MKKTKLIFFLLCLSGCEAELSNEDKESLEQLRKELAATTALLKELKISENNGTAKEFIPAPLTKPVYETETDKLFHELTRKFDLIDIRVTSTDGVFKVAFINHEKGLMNLKEIVVPLSFFKSVYDAENRYPNDAIKKLSNRGYSAELRYLLDQGKQLEEKKAILKLFSEYFS